MGMVVRLLLPEESHKDQPEHIEGRHKGDDQADHKQTVGSMVQGRKQDLILAPETCQWEYARKGKGADDKGPGGYGASSCLTLPF